MDLVARPDLESLRSRPELAPYLVRPGLGPARQPPAATGLAPLDALLGGGFPRGRISEVVGPRSSGRTSLLLAALARATACGGLAALVDVADGLDPASARAAGVVLDGLLWVRCGRRLGAALRAAEVLGRGGGFDVVAVDLGDLAPTALARVPPGAAVRLQRAVEGTATALVVAGAGRLTGGLAALVLAVRRRAVRWVPRGPGLLAGLTAEARVLRARMPPAGAAVEVRWALETWEAAGAADRVRDAR